MTPGCAASATGSSTFLKGSRAREGRPDRRRSSRWSIALLGTPLFIKFLVRRGYGQFIRDDGPTSHHTKRGTPTMGGAVIIGALARGVRRGAPVHAHPPTVSGVLVLFLMAGLGLVGFLDDYIKITKQRSLGLRSKAEARRPDAGRGDLRGAGAAVPEQQFRTPGRRRSMSFVRDTNINLAFAGTLVGLLLFVRLGQPHDRRHQQRGEPHRRPGRPGDRRRASWCSPPTC